MAAGEWNISSPSPQLTLEDTVRLMRRLGVTQYAGIVLGPEPPVQMEPPKPRSPEEQKRVSRLWDEYREKLEFAHVEGVPDEPQEPEWLP